MIKLPAISLRNSLVICVLSIFAAIIAFVATPRNTVPVLSSTLDEIVPRQFAGWKVVPDVNAQVSLSSGTNADTDKIYDQVMSRTYVNGTGERIMLSLAWGRKQAQDHKVHSPTICYPSQGYTVKTLEDVTFSNIIAASGSVTGKRMVVMNSDGRGEAVSYWIRVGNIYNYTPIDTRLYLIKEGFAGRIPDGILVRVSQSIHAVSDAKLSWPILDKFMVELVNAVQVKDRQLLLR